MSDGGEAATGGSEGGGRPVDWDADLPDYVPPVRSGPARGVVAGGVARVVALLAAGVFAVVALTGTDGADTPEAAVERLFDALADEDVIGLLEALAPGERRAVLDPVRAVTAELQRLGVLGEELDLGGVHGFDLRVEGLELASAELGPGVAEVRIVAGTLHADVRPADIPLGPVARDLLDAFEAGLEPTSESTDLAAEPDAVIVAIEEAGGWHVSLGYTIAEQWRRDAGEPLPAFGQGVQPQGADGPEEAVRAMLDAALDLDLRAVIALTPPDEMRALHDYAPLFLDEVEAEAVEARRHTDLTLDRLETEVVERRGASARVAVTGLAISGTVDGEDGSLSWDGECLEWRDRYSHDRQCLDDLEDEGLPRSVTGSLESMLRVTAVEVDGAWYLSPVRSALDGSVDLLRLLEREHVEDVAELVSDFGMFFLGAGLGGFDFDDEAWAEERWAEEGWEVAPDDRGPPGAECFDEYERALGDEPDGAGPDDIERIHAELDACLHAGDSRGWSTGGRGRRDGAPGDG